MGFFDFFKKKDAPAEETKSQAMIAMCMYNDGQGFDGEKFVADLQSRWGIDIGSIDSDQDAFIFDIGETRAAIAKIGIQIPFEEITSTAQYAYNWPKAIDDLKDHNSHWVVTIFPNANDGLTNNVLLTKLIASVMATSQCLGVYKGTSTLLIPSDQFLERSEILNVDDIPIDLMMYIGIRQGEGSNAGYTYGLEQFGKKEIEINQCPLDLDELYAFLYNISAYVIKSNITFKHGETLGYTADQKIRISETKGKYIDGTVLTLTF